MDSLHDLREESLDMRLLRKGYHTSSNALIKKRNISCVRNFPPSCGRSGTYMHVLPVVNELGADKQSENVAPSGCGKGSESRKALFHGLVRDPQKWESTHSLNKEELGGDKHTENIAASDCGKDSEEGTVSLHGLIRDPLILESTKSLNNFVDKKLIIESFTKSQGVKENKHLFNIAENRLHKSGWQVEIADMLKSSHGNIVFPKRRVSVIREYPPFCGRNAPRPPEEQLLKFVGGTKTSVKRDMIKHREKGYSSQGTERVYGKEVIHGAQNVFPRKRKLEVGERTSPRFKTQFLKNSPVRGERSSTAWKNSPERAERDSRAFRNSHVRGERGSTAPKNIPERAERDSRVFRNSHVRGERGSTAQENTLERAERDSRALRNNPVRGKRASSAMKNKPKRGESASDSGKNSFLRGGRPSGSAMKKNLIPNRKALYKHNCARVIKIKGTTRKKSKNSPQVDVLEEFEVIVPPFGPSGSGDADVRNRVRETLRLFHAICRKLLQGEEAKLRLTGSLSNRIDMLASNLIIDLGKQVNKDTRRIGSVPGVEIGDEYQYRVELALVGLHAPYQSGIDYMNYGASIIATSIVSSGVYADDLDSGDVLMYSGQGGNAVGHKDKTKQPEDQKLIRGNLALKNCIAAKTPVRVIRGYKETKKINNGRPKLITSYTYDGLYNVERYWQEVGSHGKLVYMFMLRRIAGQPELAWKELKKWGKLREGICDGDISSGKELFPVSAVNTIDDEKPPKFNYITRMKYPDWCHPTTSRGCDCVGQCWNSASCSCVTKNGGFPYTHDGAIVETKPLVYECGPHCRCPPSCYNRVSQHGIKIQLEIFKTESKGWGVRSLTSIPSGTFICEYLGELLEDEVAEQTKNDEYLFDIGQNYNDCSVTLESDDVVENDGFTIDAAESGNVGRFINHSCSPNLYAQNVLYDHEDKRMPHIMLFAADNICPLQELTYHYNYAVNQIQDPTGRIKTKNCYCGSEECTGRMY